MICEKCGIDHDGTFGSGRFCSIRCSNSRDLKTITKKKPCIICGEVVDIVCTVADRYVKCRKCTPVKEKRIKLPIKFCCNCGKQIKKGGSFCCVECSISFKWIERCDEIERCNGIGVDIRSLKKFIIHKRGHVCEICGLSEWMGYNIPLVIDHINGRAHDNRLENLRLVCGNCDMQLPTYKSKNKNSDRKR